MRLFVALNLPKKERTRIHRIAKVLRESRIPVRWVDPQNYHVTLRFLGKVPENRIDGVKDSLARVASSTGDIDLSVERFGAFPTIRRPNVIWAGVEPTPSLRCLKQDLERALKDCGFVPEKKAFHPHLTLGRVDAKGGAGAFRGLDEMAANFTYKRQVKIRKVDLMSSEMVSGSPRYRLRYSAAFG
ncbi:MAG: RNA 2',3'-cyclic phosphodiesterase [Gemmatimonadota bacterium]|nr:RNA 2',3'-cyclic phosphodiesterase [Gemmatimonadota bacterium]